MKTNLLHDEDNLDILRQGDIPEESVDLVYLDPPVNSDRDVLHHGGMRRRDCFNEFVVRHEVA